MEIDVAAVADLGDREAKVVTVGRRELVLVRIGPRVHALKNVCPHMSESFQGARVCARVVGGRRWGRLEVAEEPALICPWHGWQFELSTGQCLVDPGLRVKRYEVRVERGRVLVDL